MSADTLLARLEKVRRTGNGNWRARCPAHEDKSGRALSVAERDDMVLFHCFSGCGALDVLGAVGLDMAAVMPPKPQGNFKQVARPYPAADVLECVAEEIMIVAIAAYDMAKGRVFDDAYRKRLFDAEDRLRSACRIAKGSRSQRDLTVARSDAKRAGNLAAAGARVEA